MFYGIFQSFEFGPFKNKKSKFCGQNFHADSYRVYIVTFIYIK